MYNSFHADGSMVCELRYGGCNLTRMQATDPLIMYIYLSENVVYFAWVYMFSNPLEVFRGIFYIYKKYMKCYVVQTFLLVSIHE